MGIPARSWSGTLLDDTKVDGTALESFFDELADLLDPGTTGLVNANVATNANIDGAKLADATVTGAKLASASVTAANMALNTLTDSTLLWASTSGVKALRTSAAQRKVIYGYFEVTSAGAGSMNGTAGNAQDWNAGAAGATSGTFTVTYATHAHDYISDFSSSSGVTVIATVENSANEQIELRVITKGLTAFTFEMWDANGVGAYQPGGTIRVHWMAMGQGS